MAPRLRTKPERGAAKSGVRSPAPRLSRDHRATGTSAERPLFDRTAVARLIVAGLVALALLALGEQAPAAFPVHVRLEADSAANQVQLDVDGQSHSVSSVLGGDWQRLVLEQPEPADREYQIDGSDTTATDDRNALFIDGLLNTPLYRFDAFLRDESSYSRWERLAVVDLSTGQRVAPDAALPADFRVDVDLRRPEAVARLWLVNAAGDQREGLELDRDMRNGSWVMMDHGQAIEPVSRWFFPEQPAPFAAELLHLLGRTAVAGYALALAALGLGRLLAVARRRLTSGPVTSRSSKDSLLPTSRPSQQPGYGQVWLERVPDLALAIWLVLAALVTTEQYHQLPHILDAVSYTFQAGLFASGQLSLPAPALPDAFKGPFEIVWQGHLISQYPPGAPALYALGRLVSLEWLVGPVLCVVLIGATAWTADALYGRSCGLAVLGLGLISPFILFQAGSYLSHPIAGGILAGAIAAFVAGERYGSNRWYAVCGVLFGMAFLAREVAALLVALPLGIRQLACRRWSALLAIVVAGVPFLAVYLAYNWVQTGDPLLLPRAVFNPGDHFGFGDGVGFYMRHTLAAGLANTDELLTLLQFDLFGWPPLFALGLVLVPFLVGRARTWDFVALGGVLAFVLAYVGYFYHGIALGPRYYFEAMPWLLLLAARGVQVLGALAGSRLVAMVLIGVLTLNTVLFYTPAELERRTDMSGVSGVRAINLGFVQTSLRGPRVVGVPPNSIVVTNEWWLYNTALAALNCPQVPACEVDFALAQNPPDVEQLREAYPGRTILRAVERGGEVTVEPY